MTTTLLTVNGTLTRGLELDPNTQKASGIFVHEDRTDTRHRLRSINDRHPGMIRVSEGGAYVDVEIRQLPLVSFAELLINEPKGLTIGKIKLTDGGEVLGVLTESWLTEGQKEITALGDWRKYTRNFHTM